MNTHSANPGNATAEAGVVARAGMRLGPGLGLGLELGQDKLAKAKKAL